MSMNEANEFLSDYGGPMLPIVAFEAIGNIVKGKIVGNAKVQTQTQDGEQQKVLKIPLEVIEGSSIPAGKAGDRRNAQPGERVALWVKAGAMASALQDALNKSGAPGLQVGGLLAFKYTGDGPRPGGGKNPPKQYAAQYQAPIMSVGADDLLPPTQLSPNRPEQDPFPAQSVTSPPASAPPADELF